MRVRAPLALLAALGQERLEIVKGANPVGGEQWAIEYHGEHEQRDERQTPSGLILSKLAAINTCAPPMTIRSIPKLVLRWIQSMPLEQILSCASCSLSGTAGSGCIFRMGHTATRAGSAPRPSPTGGEGLRAPIAARGRSAPQRAAAAAAGRSPRGAPGSRENPESCELDPSRLLCSRGEIPTPHTQGKSPNLSTQGFLCDIGCTRVARRAARCCLGARGWDTGIPRGGVGIRGVHDIGGNGGVCRVWGRAGQGRTGQGRAGHYIT